MKNPTRNRKTESQRTAGPGISLYGTNPARIIEALDDFSPIRNRQRNEAGISHLIRKAKRGRTSG